MQNCAISRLCDRRASSNYETQIPRPSKFEEYSTSSTTFGLLRGWLRRRQNTNARQTARSLFSCTAAWKWFCPQTGDPPTCSGKNDLTAISWCRIYSDPGIGHAAARYSYKNRVPRRSEQDKVRIRDSGESPIRKGSRPTLGAQRLR